MTPLAVCRVRKDGSVSCLGSLGFSDPQQGKTSHLIAGLPASTVEVALGDVHGCVRTKEGEVWCWGLNEKGQLGRGAASNAFEAPAKVLGLANIVQIASGSMTTCARASDGTVWCWGTGLGDMEKLDHTYARPRRAQGITTAVDIAVGSLGACAVLANGKAQCWDARDHELHQLAVEFPGGAPSRGVVGVGDPAHLIDVDQVGVGVVSVAAHGRDGSVYTSPLHCNGRSRPTTDPHGMPTVPPKGPPGWTAEAQGRWAKVTNLKATLVASNGESGCARTSDGKVACWGCLSQTWAHDPNTPMKAVMVPNLTDVTEIGMGLTLSCALKSDDSVLCWGVGFPVMSDFPTLISI